MSTIYVVVVESDDARGVVEYDDRRDAMAHCEAAEVRGVDRAAVMAVTPDGEGGHAVVCLHAFEADREPLHDYVLRVVR